MIPERRRQTRFSMNLPIKIYEQDTGNVLDVAKAVNICAGGIGLLTTNFFSPDQNLAVKFIINSESSKIMNVQVVWAEDETTERRCGVKFLEN